MSRINGPRSTNQRRFNQSRPPRNQRYFMDSQDPFLEIERLNRVIQEERHQRNQEISAANQTWNQLQDAQAEIKKLQSENKSLHVQIQDHKSNYEYCYTGMKKEVDYFKKKWCDVRVAQVQMGEEYKKTIAELQNECDNLRASLNTTPNSLAERFESELNRERQAHLDTKASNELFVKLLTSERDSLRADLTRETKALTEMEKKLCTNSDTDCTIYKIQIENLEQELNTEITAHKQTVEDNQIIIDALTAEIASLQEQITSEVSVHQEMSEQTVSQLQTLVEALDVEKRNKTYKTEVLAATTKAESLEMEFIDNIVALLEINTENQLATEVLEAEMEAFGIKMTKQTVHKTTAQDAAVLPTTSPDLNDEDENLEMELENVSFREPPPETKSKKSSAWKKWRHFLGLRKPKSWKKKKSTSFDDN